MPKVQTGVFNLTKLNKAARAAHTAFFKNADTGDILFRISHFTNDELDQFGNICSVRLSPQKDSADDTKEGRIYFGNLKPAKDFTIDPSAADLPGDDDLPF